MSRAGKSGAGQRVEKGCVGQRRAEQLPTAERVEKEL